MTMSLDIPAAIESCKYDVICPIRLSGSYGAGVYGRISYDGENYRRVDINILDLDDGYQVDVYLGDYTGPCDILLDVNMSGTCEYHPDMYKSRNNYLDIHTGSISSYTGKYSTKAFDGFSVNSEPEIDIKPEPEVESVKKPIERPKSRYSLRGYGPVRSRYREMYRRGSRY